MAFLNTVKRLLKKKSVIALIILAAGIGGYAWYQRNKPAPPAKYVLAAVTRGSVIQTVSGSGQVSGARQFDIKPSVSANIIKINVKPGDAVTTDTVIAVLDSTDALKTIRDARQSVNNAALSLQSQQLAYDKQKAPPDAATVLTAQNAVNSAQRALDTLLAGPDKNDVANAQRDVQTQIENTKPSYDGSLSVNVRNAYDDAVTILRDSAKTSKQAVHDAQPIVDSNDSNLSNLSPSKLMDAKMLSYGVGDPVKKLDADATALTLTGADPVQIDGSLADATDALQKLVTYLQKLDDALLNTAPSAAFTQSSITTMKSMVDADLSDATSKLSSVFSQVQAISNAKTSYATAVISLQKAQTALTKLTEPPAASDVANAKDKVNQAQTSLDLLKAGVTPIDAKIAQNSLQQKQAAVTAARSQLADAQAALADYTIRPPFGGTIAAVSANVADSASPSTAIATVVTTAKIADLSLNEVDAAKVKVGQKATLTFTAIPDLGVAGIVSEVDSIGTVTQGVVNYSIKIVFETQDARVKSDMSVTAEIVTLAKPDVLTLPNAAVQSSTTGGSAVRVISGLTNPDPSAFTTGITSSVAPASQTVEVGASNDTVTEITSGLNEGDLVVLRTITSSSGSASASPSTSGFRIPGVGGGGAPGGGNATFIRRTGG
jgi:HlyD family secretion protein